MKEFFPHSATTRDITVRVSVTYLPEQSEPGFIESKRSLRTRLEHWISSHSHH